MVLSSSPIKVEAAGNNVTYFLPNRPLGIFRYFGLLPLAFGLFFVSRTLIWVSDPLRHVFQLKFGFFDILLICFLSIFVYGGFIPLRIGLLSVWGRCRIDWRDGRLTATEYVGPIRWRRKFPRKSVLKLGVVHGRPSANEKPITTGPLATLGMIAAEFEGGKKGVLAFAYPMDWLQPLAHDLSARIGASSAADVAPTVETIDAAENEPEPKDMPKPAASKIKLEERTNGITLVIPPAGIWKGSNGLMSFGMVWCLLMTIFTGVWVFADIQSGKVSWPVYLFVLAFWVIGIFMISSAINMGKRRAVLLVENGELRIAQENLFGKKMWSWSRNELRAIRADRSGMEVNDRPIIELQIHPVNGKKVGFFAGRDEEELLWLAFELRRATNVPAEVLM